MPSKSVLIVGAGPAGAALAYLLARRGVAVTLLEKHLDFARAFRGEGSQLSGVDALVQMGFGEKLARLPQAKVNVIELHRAGRLRARLNTAQLGFIGQFVSQPALLEMLTNECARFRSHPCLINRRTTGRYLHLRPTTLNAGMDKVFGNRELSVLKAK
jgi:2-polyprenyl-6-methoxyphenol hydroxylase-like FAD-dependent oxidoreductase